MNEAAPEGADRFIVAQSLESKTALAHVLLRWVSSSDAETIGDIGNAGVRKLLGVELGGGRSARLHADTSRSAVIEYLVSVIDRGAESDWKLIANRRGTFNKLLFDPSRGEVPGWYCYLEREEGAEALI